MQNSSDSKSDSNKQSSKESQTLKKIIAIGLTLLIISGIWFGYNTLINGFVNTPLANLNKNIPQEVDDTAKKAELAKAGLTNRLKSDPYNRLVIQDITLFDIKAYPQKWKAKRFDKTQIANELIAGENADPDRDGLTNRQEFLVASNPLNAYTLCGKKIENNPKCTNNDKQNIDAKLSPLTGFGFDANTKIRVSSTEASVIDNFKDSFDIASDEGFDFPEVYQLSRTVDLRGELDKIEVQILPNEAINIGRYVDARLKILENYGQLDEFIGFSKIYKTSDPKEIGKLKDVFTKMVEDLKKLVPAESQKKLHQATIFAFQKNLDVVNLRIDYITKPELKLGESEEAQKNSKQKYLELLASYRQLSEIASDTNPIDIKN